ncbi:MAG TPA: hypothetical protein VNQ31_05370 [Sphingomonadaceae bacterium]|nr:hypothetical protein [Sphingomonadaceae bacterium]
MIPTGLLAAVLATGTPAPAPPAPASPGGYPVFAQVLLRERIIIRVPTRPAAATAFIERKADKCQPMASVAAAAVVKPDNIDIIYRGGLRIRAVLENACPALDYYSGFYVQPTRDGKICAGRDSIRSRAGGECRIKRFRTLIPSGTK